MKIWVGFIVSGDIYINIKALYSSEMLAGL